MHNFDLDNALHLVQQEIDDHSLWDQYVATQNDNIHTHGLNNELSFDSFSHNDLEFEYKVTTYYLDKKISRTLSKYSLLKVM